MIFIEEINKELPFKNIKSSVVNINGKYFLRSSKRIAINSYGDYVIVEDSVIDWKGQLINKDDSVTCYNGDICRSGEYNLQKHRGEWIILGHNAIRFGGGFVRTDDPDVVFVEGYGLEHKSRCVILPSKYYGRNKDGSQKYYPQEDVISCLHTGMDFKRQDVVRLQGRVNKYISKFELAKVRIVTVVESAEMSADSTDGSYPKVYCAQYLKKEIENQDFCKSDIFGCYVRSENKEALESFWNGKMAETKSLLEIISPKYDGYKSIPFLKDQDPPERAIIREGDITGGYEYYKPNEISARKIFSQSLKSTGGIGYTFGIEHESCAGIVPDSVCTEYGLTRVGDGSTRMYDTDLLIHFEYVSSVLHGDLGVRRMYSYMGELRKHIIQNEYCSTHIHVGGQQDSGGKRKTDSPAFNRRFSAYAIRLGAMVEESLNDLMPEFRNVHREPLLGRDHNYCRSIASFIDMPINNKEDYNRIVAEFVFGHENLSVEHNSSSEVSKWSGGRYKWLNLVNCNTGYVRYRNEQFSTIEFRIFPPTTDPEKIHFYLLIALGFVWYVENRQREIRERTAITIQDVLKEAYGNKPIYEQIITKFI